MGDVIRHEGLLVVPHNGSAKLREVFVGFLWDRDITAFLVVKH